MKRTEFIEFVYGKTKVMIPTRLITNINLLPNSANKTWEISIYYDRGDGVQDYRVREFENYEEAHLCYCKCFYAVFDIVVFPLEEDTDNANQT